MAQKQRKSMQDLADMVETPAVNVSKMNAQMETAKLKKQAQKELAEERKAQFSAPVAKAKKVKAAPVVEPVVERMVATTLEEVAKVVKPHVVVLPKELDTVGTDPIYAALIEAARLRQDAVDAETEFKMKLEVRRNLLKDQGKFAPAYNSMFDEMYTKYVEQPGKEFMKPLLDSKEKHAKGLRAYVAGIINKALAAQNETAKEYLALQTEIDKIKVFLEVHVADKDQKEFKAREALSKVGIRYEDVFATK